MGASDDAPETRPDVRRIELVVTVRRDSKLSGPLLGAIIEALPGWYEDVVGVEVLMWEDVQPVEGTPQSED